MAKAFLWLKKHRKLFPWKTYTVAKTLPKYIYFFYCQHKRLKAYYKKLREGAPDWLYDKMVVLSKWLKAYEDWSR